MTVNPKRLAGFCTLTLFLLMACKVDSLQDDPPVATFAGENVTLLDLTTSVQGIPEEYRHRMEQDDPRGFREERLRSVAAYRVATLSALRAEGADSLLDLPWVQPLWEDRLFYLIDRHLLQRPSIPSATEIEEYYHRHPDEWLGFEEVSFRHVFLQVNDASPEKEKTRLAGKIQEIHREIVDGASIEELAKRYADLSEGTYERGALLTKVTPHLLNPPLREGIAKLEPGELSPPIRTPHGWEVVLLVDRKPAAPRPLKEVRLSAKSRIYNARYAEARKQLQESEIDVTVPVSAGTGTAQPDGLPREAPAYVIGDVSITAAAFEAERQAWASRQEKDPAEIDSQTLLQRLQWIKWAKVKGLDRHPVLAADLQQTVERRIAESYLTPLAESRMRTPSHDDLQTYYRQNPETFRTPEQRSGWLLTIHSGVNAFTTPPGEIYFMRQKMLERQKEAQKAFERGLSFEEVVLLYSTQEGEIRSKGYLPLAPSHGMIFDTITTNLEPGETSEWMMQKYVCHLGRLEQRIPAHIPPFEECREQVRRAWTESRRKEVRQELVDRMFQEGKLEIDWPVLMKWDSLTPLPEVHY